MPARACPRPIVWLVVASLALVGFAPFGALAAATPGVASPVAGTPVASANPAIARVDFRVNVGDFNTTAQLTYSAGRSGPFPTVILIPGSGPYDMNFTILDPATHQIRSHIFLDISDYLTLHGHATVRPN